jgi:enamine deaminase RidA (YjgF/YER057c/UK114 family)
MSFEIINPPSLGRPSGWNNGLLAPPGGRLLFVAGQDASDTTGRVPAASLADQWDRALARLLEVVRAAGGSAADIGRITVYVTDRAGYLASRQALGEIHRRHLGKHYPAMALVEVKALVDPNALVEMEATAVLP